MVDPPFIVLPLTVEPTKPRLCHDARYLNLWMRDMPFSLDKLIDLPRYVGKDTYQTVLDVYLAMTIFFFLKTAARILGSNGEGGISRIIPFLLGGRSPRLYIILLACWLLISLELQESIVCSPSMIDTMANCRWHSIRGNTLLLTLLLTVILRWLSRLYFLLLTTLSDWPIALICKSQFCSQVKWFLPWFFSGFFQGGVLLKAGKEGEILATCP